MPNYAPADQGWRALGGWHLEEGDGSWRRVYAKRLSRKARRAVVRSSGAMRWTWEVEEFDPRRPRVRSVFQRGTGEYVSAAAAWPFADLAARS